MATELKLPELGENIDGGELVNILVSAGDTIEVDQPIAEVETDKATIEIPASVGGVVKEVVAQAGEKIQVGEVVLLVETDGAADEAAPEPDEEKAEKPESDEEKEVQPESDEEEEAKPEPDEEKTEEPEPKPETKEVIPPPSAKKEPDTPRKIAPASPTVRRLARELGIDIHEVPGTGPGGRISRKDVKNYVRDLNEEKRAAAPPQVERKVQAGIEPPTLPDFTKWGEIEREPMNNIRRTTARHMSTSWLNIPHVTNFDKADITELEKLRKQYGKKADKAGARLTITAIILKVLAAALKQFPKLNASVDMERQEVVYKKYYHIGVAVDTDRGLLVPVIRDVDQKNIIQLAVELGEVAEKARDKKLSLDDMQGGTFTLTNLGGIGGTNFTPIVNHPEVAILGVARGTVEAVQIDGKFEPRLMLPLSLSYDHRLVDGADAARFLRWVAEAIEQPFLLALEG